MGSKFIRGFSHARTWLIILGLSSLGVDAQVSTQNLFHRTQWIALQQLRIAAKQYPMRCPFSNSDQEFSYQKAGDLYRKMQWEEASTIYSGLIKADSSYCDAYFRLAQCKMTVNELGPALEILTTAEKKFPKNPRVYLGLGQLNIVLNRPQESFNNYEKLTLLAPNDPEGFLGCSLALSEMSRDSVALEYLLLGRKKFEIILRDIYLNSRYTTYSGPQPLTYYSPNVRNIRMGSLPPPSEVQLDYLNLWEASLYYKVHETQKSLTTLKGAPMSTDEMEGYKSYGMALCLAAKGENSFPAAVEHLKKAMRSGITIDSVFARQVGFFFDPANFKELALIESYKDESKWSKSPKEIRRKHEEADEDFENRKIADAAKKYGGILKLDSADCRAYVKLAECYRIRKQHIEALRTYKTAYRRFSKDRTLTLLLARQLLLLDSLGPALDHYKKAIASDSTKKEGYLGASLVLAHKGALKESQRYMKLSENHYKTPGSLADWKLVAWHGALQQLMGHSQQAFSYLEKVTYNEEDALANYYLALCYNSLGEKYIYKARESMRKAMQGGAIVDEKTAALFGMDLPFQSFKVLK